MYSLFLEQAWPDAITQEITPRRYQRDIMGFTWDQANWEITGSMI